MDRAQRHGMLYVFMAVLGYSFLPTLTKWILKGGLTPLDIALWRFLFAAPLLWLIITLRRIPAPTVTLPRYHLLAMGAILAVSALVAFTALQDLPASTFIVLFYTYPAIVAVICLFLGERLPAMGWFALGLTLLGVALTAPDFNAGLSGSNLRGVLLAFANAGIVAVYFIINSRLLRNQTSLARASAWAITGALLVMLVVSLTRQVAVPSDPTTWVYLLLLAAVSTVLPVFALTSGIQKLGPARASIMGTIEPVLTTLWAMLLLNESLQPVQVLGAACILSSVILLQLRRSPRPDTFKVEATAGTD